MIDLSPENIIGHCPACQEAIRADQKYIWCPKCNEVLPAVIQDKRLVSQITPAAQSEVQINLYTAFTLLLSIAAVGFCAFGLYYAYQESYYEMKEMLSLLKGIALICAGVVSALGACVVLLVYISKLQERR